MKKKYHLSSEAKEGLKSGLPISLGYFPVSFSFGLLAVSHGLNWWQALIISMTNLTSAGQFAGLSIMSVQGTYVEMIMAQVVINLRYSLMSISLSQKIDSTLNGIYRWLAGFGVTDEIYVMAMNKAGSVNRKYFFGLLTLPYLSWAFGTLIGALCGEILPPIVRNSLGLALYGMFIAIVIPKVKEDSKILFAVIVAVLFSSLFKWVPIFNQLSIGFAIIFSSVISSLIAAYYFPIKIEEETCS